MIVYGVKATEIGNFQIMNKCSSCGTHDSMRMLIYEKYAHVFWIPFVPVGKTAATQCNYCKRVLTKKEFSPELTDRYLDLKSDTKTPLWTFSGLALLAILVSLVIISDQRSTKKKNELIANPQQGDVYEVKTGYKQYTLYKVNTITPDSVYVFLSQYETNNFSGIRDLLSKGKEAFDHDEAGFSKKELRSMLDNGKIMEIVRKND